jgi:hypothetical protein
MNDEMRNALENIVSNFEGLVDDQYPDAIMKAETELMDQFDDMPERVAEELVYQVVVYGMKNLQTIERILLTSESKLV